MNVLAAAGTDSLVLLLALDPTLFLSLSLAYVQRKNAALVPRVATVFATLPSVGE